MSCRLKACRTLNLSLSICTTNVSIVVCTSIVDDDAEMTKAIDDNMPNPNAPKVWQCTDVPAFKDLPKNRSCLAYDGSNGYTYYHGKCVPSDYDGCIDTFNKFKDMETCTQSM